MCGGSDRCRTRVTAVLTEEERAPLCSPSHGHPRCDPHHGRPCLPRALEQVESRTCAPRVSLQGLSVTGLDSPALVPGRRCRGRAAGRVRGGCASFCPSLRRPVDGPWAGSVSGCWMKLPGTFSCRPLCGRVFPSLLGRCLGVEGLGCVCVPGSAARLSTLTRADVKRSRPPGVVQQSPAYLGSAKQRISGSPPDRPRVSPRLRRKEKLL